MQSLGQLPPEVNQSLASTLEHCDISVALTEVLYQHFQLALKDNHNDNLINYLRMMSSSQATGIIELALDELFAQTDKLTLDIVLTITGRCWHLLEPNLTTLMDYLAKEHEQAVFSGIFTDLVAIPLLRPHLLAMIRTHDRSEALSRAIGKLFKSN